MYRDYFRTPEDYRDHLQAQQWMLPEGRTPEAQAKSRDEDMIDLLKKELESKVEQHPKPRRRRGLTSIYDL